MRPNILILSLIFTVSCHRISAQSEGLSCYFAGVQTYSCSLLIYNPNGRNDFRNINGTHLAGKSDADVLVLYRSYNEDSLSLNVPSIICEKFKNLQEIDLSRVGVEMKIEEETFKNCRNLTFLNLSFNKISTFHENSFTENLNLERLYLDFNQLAFLNENLFINQHKLLSLTLGINNIQDLPKNIFKSLTNLESLGMNINLISNLRAEWFEALENLKYLDLQLNQIEVLPRNIFSTLTSLQQISLFKNKLKVINSNSFSLHPELINVYLHNNLIDAIDEKFIDNTGVIQFGMENNACADSYIFDNSTSREFMRAELKTCFENFLNLNAGRIILWIPNFFFTFYA